MGSLRHLNTEVTFDLLTYATYGCGTYLKVKDTKAPTLPPPETLP